MEYNLITNVESCYYGISHLIYYSHIPTAILALLMGGFVFLRNRKLLVGKILFSLSIIFSLWSLLNLILWVNPDSRILMFLWSLFGVLDIFISALGFYFIYVFIYKKDIDFKFKLFLMAIILPAILFNLKNATGFDISNCEAIEGEIYNYYILGLDL
ncbi:MAG: hypothetical protein Q8M12_01340, partial [bacterium]|nr:hypothetical protein [bacterium]